MRNKLKLSRPMREWRYPMGRRTQGEWNARMHSERRSDRVQLRLDITGATFVGNVKDSRGRHIAVYEA